MISTIISRLVILVFGTLYPAYASYKAVKTKNIREYVKWMMYWIVFAIFTAAETFADVFISWIPFYYELKIVFVFWLLSPATRGSSILYRNFVHPRLVKYEPEIDRCISTATEKGYSGMMEVTSRGLDLVKHAVITAAIKGQTTLVTQLSAVERSRSVSLTDMRAVGVNGNGEPAVDDFESLGQDLVNGQHDDIHPGRRASTRRRQVTTEIVESNSNIPQASGQALARQHSQPRLTPDNVDAEDDHSQYVQIKQKHPSVMASMLYPTAAVLATNLGIGAKLREINMERVAVWLAHKGAKRLSGSKSNSKNKSRESSGSGASSSFVPDVHEATGEDFEDQGDAVEDGEDEQGEAVMYDYQTASVI